MEMKFHLLQDRVDHGMFCVYWSPGNGNLDNHYTKGFLPLITKTEDQYIYT